MKLREYAKKYYLMDYNCAETILLAAREKYQLSFTEENIAMIGAFGGGMACGLTCGALTGGIASIGKKMITTRAHDTEGLKEITIDYVDHFKRMLGSTECSELKERFKTEADGCMETVLLGADVLENIINKNQL